MRNTVFQELIKWTRQHRIANLLLAENHINAINASENFAHILFAHISEATYRKSVGEKSLSGLFIKIRKIQSLIAIPKPFILKALQRKVAIHKVEERSEPLLPINNSNALIPKSTSFHC